MRHEHDDIVHLHFRRLHIVAVVLLCQAVHLILQTRHVGLQETLALALVRGIDVVHESSQRHLRIHDDIALAVEVQNDIRSQSLPLFRLYSSTSCIAHRRLYIIMHTSREALCLQQLIEHRLTPCSLYGIATAEHSRQLVGTLPCLFAGLHHLLDDGLQRAAISTPLRLRLTHHPTTSAT